MAIKDEILNGNNKIAGQLNSVGNNAKTIKDLTVKALVDKNKAGNIQETPQIPSDLKFDPSTRQSDLPPADNTAPKVSPTPESKSPESKGVKVEPQGVRPGETTITPTKPTNEQLFWRFMGSKQPETENQKMEREKRERRRKYIASIGDSLAAISNLITTTQYAPNQQQKMLSDKEQERQDTLKKEREANDKAFYEGYIKAKKADEDKTENERDWLYKLGVQDFKERQAEAKEERDRQMFDLNLLIKNNKISEAEARARKAQIDADYAASLNDAKIISYRNRGRGGGGSGATYTWYDEDGNKHTEKSYKEARDNARRAGTWVDDESTETTEHSNSRGRVTKTDKKTKPKEGYSKKPEKKQTPSNGQEEIVDNKPGQTQPKPTANATEEVIDYVPGKTK